MYGVKISQQIRHKMLTLTLALYRVTDSFPHTEVLRRQTREKANEILGAIFEYEPEESWERFEQQASRIQGKIKTIEVYLRLAAAMRFAEPINFAVLEREYEGIARQFIEELKSASHEIRPDAGEDGAPTSAISNKDKKTIRASRENIKDSIKAGTETGDKFIKNQNGFGESALNERQKKILAHIQQKIHARLSDFFIKFNEISPKTIQRDLHELVTKDLVKREGDRRWTVYSLKM